MTWWLQKTDKKGGGIDFFKKHITNPILIRNGRKAFGLDVAISSKSSLRGETLFRRGNPVCFSHYCFWQVDRHRLRLRDDEQSDVAISQAVMTRKN